MRVEVKGEEGFVGREIVQKMEEEGNNVMKMQREDIKDDDF